MMPALELDFARRRPAWPPWLALLVGMALVADTGLQYVEAQDAIAEIEPVLRKRIEMLRHLHGYQTTSAIAQLSPEPMPIRATRLPGCRRPCSAALARTSGAPAGPTLPYSG